MRTTCVLLGGLHPKFSSRGSMHMHGGWLRTSFAKVREPSEGLISRVRDAPKTSCSLLSGHLFLPLCLGRPSLFSCFDLAACWAVPALVPDPSDLLHSA